MLQSLQQMHACISLILPNILPIMFPRKTFYLFAKELCDKTDDVLGSLCLPFLHSSWKMKSAAETKHPFKAVCQEALCIIDVAKIGFSDVRKTPLWNKN